MGSELPDNERQNGEPESTLILGSRQDQSSPGPGTAQGEDLSSPVQPSSSSRPNLQTPAEPALEMDSLKHELEVTTAKLRQEHEQLLKAEAQLAAVQQEPVGDATSARAIQELLRLETRQMELIERMELLLDKENGLGVRSAAANGWPFQLRSLLSSLAAGMLGGGMVVGMLPWLGVQRQVAQSPGQLDPAPPAASPVQPQETVQFRCAEPCWLDIRTADSGKRVFSKLLKGTANIAVGTGLDVFSGRADLVKVRVNDGAEEPLLSGRVVGGRVIRPSKAAEPSP